MFAVVNSAVEYWILSHKRYFTCKIITRNAEVQQFECAPVTPMAWVQIRIARLTKFSYTFRLIVFITHKTNEVVF